MLKRGQRRQELGHYEIELKVTNVLRGEAAEEQLYDLSAYVLDEQKILDSQEYMLINLTVNIPSAHLDDDALLIIDSMDFGVINSKTGKNTAMKTFCISDPMTFAALRREVQPPAGLA